MRAILAPAAMLLLLEGGSAPAPSTVFLRVNQLGYRLGDPKVALALTDRDLAGERFDVLAGPGGEARVSAPVGRDRGPYGRFAHVYELDFSSVSAKGDYLLKLREEHSPSFVVAADAYAPLLSKSLEFFRVQRCGNTAPRGHRPCHLQDGRAHGGPANGSAVRATGGWHDAGDYIKFVVTAGYATHLMLATYTRHPGVFSDEDGNGAPDILDEARIGLDWLLALWDAKNRVLYYQAADESDHETWRLPDRDKGPRPVWACEEGRGANVAGKAAASLALGAVIWGEPGKPWTDPGLAASFREAARQVYAWGKERREPQPSNPPDFYRERTVEDDLALAAAALYRATGEAAYLAEARTFARAAGNKRDFSWADSHALAHYEVARLDPSYAPEAAASLKANLEVARAAADADAFRVGLSHLHWGSAPVMAGVALQAFCYKDLTSDARYAALAQSQWDYLLGRNPWGVTFVNGAGTTWSRHPHHQVADLTGTPLTGFWNEGPVPRSAFEDRKITLSAPDAYAAFQSDGAVYHDDKEDYTTNEPTLDAAATGLALTAWYVATR